MGPKNPRKLVTALRHLTDALAYYEQVPDAQQTVAFLAVAKAFEVAVEYAWKDLKQRVEAEGLDVVSPKDAIRQAASIGIIAQAEPWLDFVNARNNSVHDYFGIPEHAYLTMSRAFLKACHPLTAPPPARKRAKR